jgi:hypothetical protein
MTTFLRTIPTKVAGLAAGAARTSLHLAGTAAEAAVGRIRGRRGRGRPMPEPPPSRNRTPVPPAVTRRPGAAPSRARAAAPPPPAAAPPAAAPPAATATAGPPPVIAAPEPTRADAARLRQQQREAEQTDDSPGPEIRVDEPWPGYAAMTAPAIIDRLGVSDEAVKAVVLLYEEANRGRKTVLSAARGR